MPRRSGFHGNLDGVWVSADVRFVTVVNHIFSMFAFGLFIRLYSEVRFTVFVQEPYIASPSFQPWMYALLLIEVLCIVFMFACWFRSTPIGSFIYYAYLLVFSFLKLSYYYCKLAFSYAKYYFWKAVVCLVLVIFIIVHMFLVLCLKIKYRFGFGNKIK